MVHGRCVSAYCFLVHSTLPQRQTQMHTQPRRNRLRPPLPPHTYTHEHVLSQQRQKRCTHAVHDTFPCLLLCRLCNVAPSPAGQRMSSPVYRVFAHAGRSGDGVDRHNGFVRSGIRRAVLVPYTASAWYWEAVLMSFRVLIALVFTFGTSHPAIQAVVVSVLCTAFAGAHVVGVPLRDAATQRLHPCHSWRARWAAVRAPGWWSSG